MKYDITGARLYVIDTDGVAREVADVKNIQTVNSNLNLGGLMPVGSFTITGQWQPADFRLTCPICGMRFTPEAEIPQPYITVNDVELGPCCAACAVQLVEDHGC